MRLISILLAGMVVIPATRTIDIPTQCLMPKPMMVMAQEGEGNPGHKAPPPGAFCAHGKGSDKDAPCKCHRECKDEDELDMFGEHTGRKITRVHEDPKCNHYCYATSCQCPVVNCD